MKQRHRRSDDVLFIAALAAVLLGIGLLLYTTGAVSGALKAWPVLVMAVGGALLYFSLVRGSSDYFFFGGMLFVLIGLLSLIAALAGWSLKESWPLAMAAAGLTGMTTGMRRKGGLRPVYAAPSIGFIALGLIFTLFSFRIVDIGLGRFVAAWWPSLLIAAGVILFAAYGYSRRFRARHRSIQSHDQGPHPARKPPRDTGAGT